MQPTASNLRELIGSAPQPQSNTVFQPPNPRVPHPIMLSAFLCIVPYHFFAIKLEQVHPCFVEGPGVAEGSMDLGYDCSVCQMKTEVTDRKGERG